MNLISILLLLSCCTQDRCRASDARAAAPSAVLIVAMRKDDSSAEVTWSQMALNDLAFLERALTSSITQEFMVDDD